MLVRQAPSSEKRDDNLKIIDFERKGNLVRFYLGSDSVEDYSGEGWETAPYSRAKTVDAKYIAGIADCVFPFDVLVLEPDSGEEDVRYSKFDMKAGAVPCIIAVPTFVRNDSLKINFSHWSNCRGILKFYFGDHLEPSNGVAEYISDKKELRLRMGTEVFPNAQPTQASPSCSIRVAPVPLWERNNLTIEEAAAYFNIGQNKIRELSNSRNCNFVLFNGSKRLIKRKAFEKFLEGAYSL